MRPSVDVRERLIRYGVAVVSSGAVLLLSLLIHPKLDLAVLPMFLAAVMLSAWRSGWGPGIVATVLSSLAATYFFMPPVRSLALPENVAHVGEFVLSGAVITGLTAALRRSLDKTRSDHARAAFLAEAGALLHMPLSDEGGLKRLSDLAVREFADGCSIKILSGPGGEAREITSRRKAPSQGDYGGRLEFPLGARMPMGSIAFLWDRPEPASEPIVRETAHALSERLSLALENTRLYAEAQQEIVRRKAAEEELRRFSAGLEARVTERTMELQAAVQELDAFAYTVAHDLRAPLRAMSGFGQLLLEEYAPRLDDTARDYASRVTEAARRMDSLIQDLLTYTRLSREEVRLEPVDLDESWEGAAQALSEEAKRLGASMDRRGPLGRAMAKPALVFQVFTNLLSNALKFTRPGERPRVRVQSEERGLFVRVWVEDKGIGIAPQHHERIFGVFERLNVRERYPGMGIGLATVRRAVARMGGACGVESREGEGSRFWVELRKASEEAG
jgi:signal transduction histidine kinase